jgi:DNA-binding transcriptional LysR family regulator
MALNLHLLRLFHAVQRHGGFSRAAAALHVSQPAVSKGLRELEGQLGAPLLERRPEGPALTEAGRRLAPHVEALFAAERAAEEAIAELRGLARGVLHVGASTTVATYHLPPVLGAFHSRHPGIELVLTSANTASVAERLRARELDVALVEGPVSDPGLVVRPWRDDPLVLIASPSHPFASTPPGPADLEAALFLVREPGSGTREVVEAALARQDLRPRSMEVGSTEVIKQMVAAGVGVALVSARAAADQIALGKLRVVALPGFSVSRVLTQLSIPGRQPSPAAAAFARLLDNDGAYFA